MNTRNATTAFLCQLSPKEFSSIKNRVEFKLSKKYHPHVQGWIHDTLISWMSNDSFQRYLNDGNKISVTRLSDMILDRTITIRQRLATDALTRSWGYRTEAEFSLTPEQQIKRTNAANPAEIFLQTSEEEEEETEAFDVVFDPSNYLRMKQRVSDLRMYLNGVIPQRWWASRLDEILDWHLAGQTHKEIGILLGEEGSPITKWRISEIFATIRSFAKIGKDKGLIE